MWTLDTSAWPVVVHGCVGVVPDDQVDDYLAAAAAVLERPEVHAVVLDATHVRSVSAYTRRRIVEWHRVYHRRLNERCAGVAYVLPSPLIRFAAMTVLLVSGISVPYTLAATREEAEAWARARVRGSAPAPGTLSSAR